MLTQHQKERSIDVTEEPKKQGRLFWSNEIITPKKSYSGCIAETVQEMKQAYHNMFDQKKYTIDMAKINAAFEKTDTIFKRYGI